MKKIFIGLAAVAAMGVFALCFINSKTCDLLFSGEVNASAYIVHPCAYQPNKSCTWVFPDESITIPNATHGCCDKEKASIN